MIMDGGPEFRGDFGQSGEYAGILQVIVDADAPWCERHGELVEDLLAKDSRLKSFSRLTIWRISWQKVCR